MQKHPENFLSLKCARRRQGLSLPQLISPITLTSSGQGAIKTRNGAGPHKSQGVSDVQTYSVSPKNWWWVQKLKQTVLAYT